MTETTSPAASKVRFHVLSLATGVAFLMYLDRICMAEILGSSSFKQSMPLDQAEVGQWARTLFFWLPQSWQDAMAASAPTDWIKGAFFYAYALAQLPAGWLSDRFGTRPLIAIYIALWSLFTAATSFSWGFTSLMLARLGCGLAEAGYYPASSGMLTCWASIDGRGMASAMISWGGRLGGVLAPVLTAFVILKSGDWRWAGWIYGFGGVGVAAAFWWAFREHPKLHPRCNEAEIALLAEGRGDFSAERAPPSGFPWAAVLSSGNLWLMNGYQFFTNIGWAFLVLNLSDYLKTVLHQAEGTASTLTSIVLALGLGALPLGGWVTDLCAKRFGLRLGRVLPLSLSKFAAVAAYLLAVAAPADAVWAKVLCFAAVAFFADFALPTVWSFMQDISGRHQAQLFGWCNMWGNIGAAVMPILFTAVVRSYDTDHDFSEGILLCAGGFLVAALIGLGMDGRKAVSL
jgi:MFS family permease